MYEPLAPCPGCRRHVRVADAACPFCASSLASARTTPDARTRLRRSALAVFATTLVACGGSTTDTGEKDVGVTDAASDANKDGGATTDSAVDTGPTDTGGIAPPYGIPADTGLPPDGGPSDTGSPGSDYGAPPPTDAGPG